MAGRCLCGLMLFLALGAQAADRYTMDPAHSIPVFEFQHLGMTKQSGRFDKASGSLELDRKNHQGSVAYEIDASSLNMGFGTESADSPGYLLFEITTHPTIRFASKDLYFDADDNVIAASGELTLLGVSRPINVWVSHFRCSIHPMLKREVCAGNVEATLNRSDFGMVRFIPGISDEIKIVIPVEAYKN